MLRTRLSAPSLRSLARTQAISAGPVPRVPALPAQFASVEQPRGLASAVLLSSRENWGQRTVKSLKDALAQRGLSRTGDKKTLVARLESFEQQANVSSSSRSTLMAGKTSPIPQPPKSRQIRAVSSTAARKADAGKQDSEVPPSSTPTSPSDVHVLSTAEVSLPASPIPAAPINPTSKGEEVSSAVAPGVPIEAAKESGVLDVKDEEIEARGGLTIEMPTYGEEKEELAQAPFTPDNFSSPEAEPEVPAEDSQPKVTTAAGSASQVQHALHETVDNLTSDASEAAEAALAESKKGLNWFSGLSLGGLGSGSAAGVGKTLRSIKLPQGEPAGEFKPIERGLEGEEKTGAYILGGIVALGLLLGGGKKVADKASEHHDSHGGKNGGGKGKSGGSSKVKGDAEWEKASGAGIVGHGARKA